MSNFAVPEIKQHKMALSLNGINHMSKQYKDLYDCVNMNLKNRCETRLARTPEMFISDNPDQIVKCGGRVFLRYENVLKEVSYDTSGNLCTSDFVIQLNNISPAPDRIMLEHGQNLYVIPDNIVVLRKYEQWETFAQGQSISMSMPFFNSTTLLYLKNSSGVICNDYALLTVGTKVMFSWLEDQVFKVKKYEKVFSVSGDSEQFCGVRITLDNEVSDYRNIPSNSYMKIAKPQTISGGTEFSVGKNAATVFSNNSIIFNDLKNGYKYKESPAGYFRVGQRVTVSGSTVLANNKTAIITQMDDVSISFDTIFDPATEEAGREITLKPFIPDMQQAYMLDGRLFGAENSTKTFWISRQDEPFCFDFCENDALSAWHCSMPGEATGICRMKDVVVCFTAADAFKIFGVNSLNFSPVMLAVSGLPKEYAFSLFSVSGQIFYCNSQGALKYNGTYEETLSSNSGVELSANDAAALNDCYYILTPDRVWIYSAVLNKWWSEDAEGILKIFTAFGHRYFLSDKVIYKADAKTDSVDFLLQTNELPYLSNEKVQPIMIKAEVTASIPTEATFQIKMRGEKEWKTAARVSVCEEQVLQIPLVKTWCNGLRIKIFGRGNITIENISLIYRRKNL